MLPLFWDGPPKYLTLNCSCGHPSDGLYRVGLPSLLHGPQVGPWTEVSQSEPFPLELWIVTESGFHIIGLSRWMHVPLVASCNSWSRSCLEDRKEIMGRNFRQSLTRFSVLGSSHSREPAVLDYVTQYWIFTRNSFFKNLLLSQLKWESYLKLNDP